MTDQKVEKQCCRVCGNRDANRTHCFREVMFGLDGEYPYLECGSCGCLQIKDMPEDMGRFYGAQYYSFASPGNFHDHAVKRTLKKMRLQAALGGAGLWTRLFLTLYRPHASTRWLQRAGVASTAAILDVGCGAGDLLVRMRKDGFTRLTGIDPHLDKDREYPGGVRLFRKELSQLEGTFDCVMLHHSFEHMADPHHAMEQVARLLIAGGAAIVRLPITGTHAWRTYGRDWVQLDSPRHLFIHTVRSMEIVARKAGLVVEEVVFDSDGFQFWGSEQVRRGIWLKAPGSLAVDRKKSIFSDSELKRFAKKARQLNTLGDGDQAGFVLRKPGHRHGRKDFLPA